MPYGECSLTEYDITATASVGGRDSSLESSFSVCGRVNEVVWDKTGTRIAVSFLDNPEVALFSVSCEQQIDVHPLYVFLIEGILVLFGCVRIVDIFFEMHRKRCYSL